MKLFSPILDYSEGRIEPFPNEKIVRPPATFLPFVWHYSKDSWPWLLIMAVFSGIIAVLEISLFGFLGSLVDWLGNRDPQTIVREESASFIWMGLVILVILPLVSFVQSVLLHQVVFGNFVMTIRWKAHQWMLGQSYSFYQDEFAGRVATKVMQTSLALRDAVLKVLDVLVYVGVFFVGAVALMSSFNTWMIMPFALWIICYVSMLRYFLPRLKKVSRLQADARSEMTGRIVDSYTNIMTVKLFAHAGHEARYARDSMRGFLHTVYPQFRLVTGLNACLDIINALLLFGVGAVGVALWINGQIGVGAVAVGVGLVLRLQGLAHWIMWELSGLFESIGIIYDGMDMLSTRQEILDSREAVDLPVPAGRIELQEVTFHYGKDKGAIDRLDLDIAGGEKIGLVGRSGAGKTTLTN